MIAKNSCSLISPSWSRSNSSIIACLRKWKTRGEQIWNANREIIAFLGNSGEQKLVRQREDGRTAPRTKKGCWARVLRSVGFCALKKVGDVRGRSYSQLIVLQTVTYFLCHSSEIPETNLSRVIVVEQLECTTDLLHRISCEDPLAHWEFDVSNEINEDEIRKRRWGAVKPPSKDLATGSNDASGHEHVGWQ